MTTHPPALALFEPDRAHNFGSALRLCACLDLDLHIIEPTGFPLDDRRIRQAALDYGAVARWHRHADFAAFDAVRRAHGQRLVLLTKHGSVALQSARFAAGDIVLAGNESRGVPAELHRQAALRLRIPMLAGLRSLNLVTAATLALGEAMRQTSAFDALEQ